MIMDRATLAKRIQETSNLKGEFCLRSGQMADHYFDKYLFESQPQLLFSIAQHMVSLIPQDLDALAGLEMGGIPVATVLSQVAGLPSC